MSALGKWIQAERASPVMAKVVLILEGRDFAMKKMTLSLWWKQRWHRLVGMDCQLNCQMTIQWGCSAIFGHCIQIGLNVAVSVVHFLCIFIEFTPSRWVLLKLGAVKFVVSVDNTYTTYKDQDHGKCMIAPLICSSPQYRYKQWETIIFISNLTLYPWLATMF